MARALSRRAASSVPPCTMANSSVSSRVRARALRSAQAAVTAAQAQFTEAQNNYERQKFLLARDVASRVQYERAEQTRDTAQAQLDSAQAQLKIAQDQLSPAKWSRPGN